MDANSVIAIARLTLLMVTVGIFTVIYCKLRFRGFLTLSIGFAASFVVALLLQVGVIKAPEMYYLIITFVIAVMYLASAILIYSALISFQRDKNN